MAGRLRKILSRLSGCYLVTRSIKQSVYFAFKVGRNKRSAIRLNNNYVIQLRKNESDQEVFLTTFVDKYHRSPFNLGQSPVIIDLGCNIGLTIVDFKQQYPFAKVIGVEMDKDNYESCRVNISRLTDCTLLHAAIWKENGAINYKGENEQSYAVERNSFGSKGIVRCMTIESLINENNIANIDYIKMDIEGVEKEVLLDNISKPWLKQVKYLSIEIHDHPEMDNAVLASNLKSELEAHHFIVFKQAEHWSSLFAVNKLWFSD